MMATDSDKVLTRYTNAETIVTSDLMNKMFGGEFGHNDSVDEFDPLVAGHVHDGLHADGHASKILLTEGAHIRGYLSSSNLGGTDGTTPAVQYKNIKCYSDAIYGSPAQRRADAAAGGYDLEILAIPEFIEDSDTGERCYYLDLSNSAGGIDGSVQFNEGGAFSGNNDLFYDYSNLMLGAGTAAPTNKLHIVDSSSPPLRVEGITSGSGDPIVVDSNGVFYKDSTVGIQDLFHTIVLSDNSSSGGSGQQLGDVSIVADDPLSTLGLIAGDNITLTGDATLDAITIAANTANPGGNTFNLQFHDGSPTPNFAGSDAFKVNNIPAGNGFRNGPAIIVENLAPGIGDHDRFSFIEFRGNSGSSLLPTGGIYAFHHTYNNPGVNNDSGSIAISTNHHINGITPAILIDGGQDSQDFRGHVGIGAASPAEPLTPAGFKTPARRLHVRERLDVVPAAYSPVRINNLYDGPGSIVLWNGPAANPVAGYPHEGDLYKLSPGTEGQALTVDSNGNPQWSTISSSETKFQTQWDGVSGWTQGSAGPNGYNPSIISFAQGRGVATRVLVTGSDRDYYLTVPVPLNGDLSQGVGSGTPGSHGNLSAYIDPVSGVEDIPSTCRLTAYFVINGGAEGNPIADFSATLYYGSDQSQGVSSGQMRDFADGEYIYEGHWNSKHFNSENVIRTSNSYGTANDGMIIVCDFSGLKITTDMLSAGLFSFKLEYATTDGINDYFTDGAPTNEFVGLIGSRILWTWELSPAENVAPPQNNAPNPAPNQAPTAVISGSTTGVEGSLISLSALSSSDPDGDPLTYSWSFGSVPGGSALANLVSSSAGFDFTPDVAGSYVAQLIVNDGQVDSNLVTQEVVVSAANQAPTAVISGPTTGVEASLISLDGSSSSDPDGDPLTYSWSFDSVPGGSALGGVTGSSAGFDFTPDVAGSYVAQLIVNDGQLSSSSVTQEVVVSAANQAPIPKVSASIDAENSSVTPYDNWILISPNISQPDIVSDPTLVNLTHQGADIPRGWEVGLFAAKSSDAEDTGGSEDSFDQNVDLTYSWTILESPTSGAYEPLLNIINPNQNIAGDPYVLYDISGSVLKIKPSDPGHYTVRMEVEDSAGAKSEFLIRFRVSN